MEFVTTKTETEALLLEINLIKQLKPRFNVLLRDDKSLCRKSWSARDHAAPQIRKHRGAHTVPGDYFGPFASTWAVNRTLTTLQKAFLLRSCSDSVFESRTRPCMLHQIKRCSAPCVNLVTPEDYLALVQEAHDFLTGKSRAVMARLSDEMQQASEVMDFESAARVRDRIRALAAIAMEQSVNPETVDEADVFALHAEGGQACVQVFFFRAGQNWGNRAYFPRVDKTDEDPDILDAFIGQFYDDKPDPAAGAGLARHAQPRSAGRGFHHEGGTQGRDRHTPARREARTGRNTPWSMRARRWAARWRRARRKGNCCRAWPRPSALKDRRTASRSTTTPTSWAPTRWAA